MVKNLKSNLDMFMFLNYKLLMHKEKSVGQTKPDT